MTTNTTPKANTKADLHMKLQSALQLNSYLVSRLTLARGLGQSFDGDRDLYQVLGYPLNPDYNNYLNCYERDGIATRVVDAAPNETWRKHPILYVGNETPSEDEPGALQEKFNEFCNEHDLWAAFNDLDKACGISRFGLLFLGVPGELEQPAQKGKLAYVTVHDEGNAEVDEMSIVQDPANPRFGLPEYYQIVVDDKTNAKRRVHYSRVLHYKDGRDRNGLGRVYGVPRLKNIINRLYDLEKVVGGGSEAFWLLIRKGLALIAKEGMSLPDPGTDEYTALQDEIDEFNHGLKRYMRLVGMDIKDLGAEPVDSREQFDVIIEYIAGSEGIPQRILLGSERGELASGQDEMNWEKVIDWRRRNVAEPYILRPFLKMAKTLGFFNVPDNYKVFWPPLMQLSETQDASVAVQIAGAISTITGGAPEVAYPAEEFISRLPGKWRFVPTAEQAAKMEEKKRQPDEANVGGDKDKDAPEKDGIEAFLKKVKEEDAITNQGTIGALLLNVGTPEQHSVVHFWQNVNEHSAMIALLIPDALKGELKQKYPFIPDEILEELHITLVYLGDIRTLDRGKIHQSLKSFAAYARPIKVTMQGLARFVDGGNEDPIVATFDSPDNEIGELRQELINYLIGAGVPYHKEHGFIPHMTLTYISSRADLPIETIEPLEMNFDSCFFVVSGSEPSEYKFSK